MDKIIDINAYPVKEMLKILLKDKTTGKNIIWSTDTYSSDGFHNGTDAIEVEDLTGFHAIELQPRISKDIEEQQARTRKKAEVFTPVWLCNQMNNYADKEWFGRDIIFNIETENGWTTVEEPIVFPEGKTWKEYVDSRRIEITCGEAPFLVSRYDAATGELIEPIKHRIGLLDRKLRIVDENATDKKEWLKWSERAFQSSYGFEYQGDNLLIARINCIMTFYDYYINRWNENPDTKMLKRIANIISWNIWQMDGFTDTVPLGKSQEERIAALCKIQNWRDERHVIYQHLKQKGHDYEKRKKFFDFCCGNPPYQMENENNRRKPPIYNIFMDEAFKVANTVELITPARFLFNAGQTPKAWNEKMLNDEHYKVLHYNPDASKYFPNTEIKGGVAITLRDASKTYGALKVFTAYDELNDIVKKVFSVNSSGEFLDSIISSRGNYRTTTCFFEDYPFASSRLGKGTGNMISSNFFEKIPEVYTETRPDDGEEYIKFLARVKNKRVMCFLNRKYVQENDFISVYNVAFPKSSGNGIFGEVLTSTEVLAPNEGATDTFISIGYLKTKQEANNLQKYICTKFFRALLGVKKVTHNNSKSVWNMIPLQDFSTSSDINWENTIHEIDLQLYHKYGLSAEEVAFIEANVKEMKQSGAKRQKGVKNE